MGYLQQANQSAWGFFRSISHKQRLITSGRMVNFTLGCFGFCDIPGIHTNYGFALPYGREAN